MGGNYPANFLKLEATRSRTHTCYLPLVAIASNVFYQQNIKHLTAKFYITVTS